MDDETLITHIESGNDTCNYNESTANDTVFDGVMAEDTQGQATLLSPYGAKKLQTRMGGEFMDMEFIKKKRRLDRLTASKAYRFKCSKKMMRCNRLQDTDIDGPVIQANIESSIMYVCQKGSERKTGKTNEITVIPITRILMFMYADERDAIYGLKSSDDHVRLTRTRGYTAEADVIPSQGSTGYIHLDSSPPIKSLVFASNLADWVQESHLYAAFTGCVAVCLPQDASGKSLGYGWLTFPTHKETEEASATTGVTIKGRPVTLHCVTFPKDVRLKNRPHDLAGLITEHEEARKKSKDKAPSKKFRNQGNGDLDSMADSLFTEIGRNMMYLLSNAAQAQSYGYPGYGGPPGMGGNPGIICYFCGESGHPKRKCPHKKAKKLLQGDKKKKQTATGEGAEGGSDPPTSSQMPTQSWPPSKPKKNNFDQGSFSGPDFPGPRFNYRGYNQQRFGTTNPRYGPPNSMFGAYGGPGPGHQSQYEGGYNQSQYDGGYNQSQYDGGYNQSQYDGGYNQSQYDGGYNQFGYASPDASFYQPRGGPTRFGRNF